MNETESITPPEKCLHCPNRSRASKFLACLVGKETLAPGCEGPVSVAHGVIESQLRYKGEPSPKKSEFNWNSMTGPARDDSGRRRYSKTSWTIETVCGREAIEPREDEVPYDTSKVFWTNKDGSRHAAFITGDEEQISEHRSSQGIMALLDNVSRLQAENATEDEKNNATHNIADMGLTILASAGRGTHNDKYAR